MQLPSMIWGKNIVIMEDLDKSWKKVKTIPKISSFENSLPLMTSDQIDLNIVEICLLALNNDNMMKWLINSMSKNEFYLKYRYILEKVLNGNLSETVKKNSITAFAKFDERYVNGEELSEFTQKKLMKLPYRKEKRLRFACEKERIITILNELSTEVFSQENQDEKRETFELKITEINSILQMKEEDVTIDSESSQDEKQYSLRGFCFYLQKSLRRVVNINLKNSYFIKTKNRHPLVLDFEFGKFLYKNDDQLAHEIISMEFIKYMNALLGKEYIIPYEILPEKYGALYQFIEHSRTIHDLKTTETEGLKGYFEVICAQKSEEAVMSRFVQTYSGFCLIQYLLDIKDRNNANIMIREDGSIFHIDLAFIFGSGPGGISFQNVPFKFTKEYLSVLGGFQSDHFRRFEALLVQHMTKIFECRQQLLWKLQILSVRKKQIRCFQDFKMTDFRKKIPKKLESVKRQVEQMIEKSFDSWKTNKYDDFQFKNNGILR